MPCYGNDIPVLKTFASLPASSSEWQPEHAPQAAVCHPCSLAMNL